MEAIEEQIECFLSIERVGKADLHLLDVKAGWHEFWPQKCGIELPGPTLNDETLEACTLFRASLGETNDLASLDCYFTRAEAGKADRLAFGSVEERPDVDRHIALA